VLPPAKVKSATINGKKVRSGGPYWSVYFGVAPRSGETDLLLNIESTEAPRMRITELFYELPEDLLAEAEPMPDWMMLKANTLDFWERNAVDSNRTHIMDEFELPPTAK